MSERKNLTMTFRLSQATKDGLQTISGRESRSIANSIEWLVKTYFETRGLPWPLQEQDSPNISDKRTRRKGMDNA